MGFENSYMSLNTCPAFIPETYRDRSETIRHKKTMMNLREANTMSLNKYGDSVEQWKVDLIVRRAHFFGFREEDIQDIQQELVLKLMTFKYDV